MSATKKHQFFIVILFNNKILLCHFVRCGTGTVRVYEYHVCSLITRTTTVDVWFIHTSVPPARVQCTISHQFQFQSPRSSLNLKPDSTVYSIVLPQGTGEEGQD